MKKSAKTGIVVLMLLLAVGFASVATSLIIGNSARIGFNNGEFDIYFSSASTEEGGEAQIDQETHQTIEFSTVTLSANGDSTYLDYDVTNDSTIYDAHANIRIDVDDTEGAIDYRDYVEVTLLGFEDENTLVKAKSTVPGRIRIKLINQSAEVIEVKFKVTLSFSPVERNSDANEDNPNCVSDGHYILKCSCDNRTLEWLDGPYFDDWGNKMNSTRTQDLTYPPADTYKCYCGENGEEQGYVVNTGDIEGTICGID